MIKYKVCVDLAVIYAPMGCIYMLLLEYNTVVTIQLTHTLTSPGILKSWDTRTVDGPITSIKLFSVMSEAAKVDSPTGKSCCTILLRYS